MNTSSIKNFDELPLFLNAQLVSRALGVSPSSAYELLHEDGFPSLRIGSRLVVPKEQFRLWVGCFGANEAYDALYGGMFDLIVSDIMMPGVDGFEFARTVRDTNAEIPILFMTARDDIASKQRGFRIGVDDYMVKPIDLDELFLRIGALLRRAKIASSRKIEIGSFTMDADEHTAYLGDEEISLTNREFSLLFKLLSYPKKTFTRTQLLDEFWDAETETAPRAVDVYMTKLRAKLAGCEDFEIKTVHGLGYKVVIR